MTDANTGFGRNLGNKDAIQVMVSICGMATRKTSGTTSVVRKPALLVQQALQCCTRQSCTLASITSSTGCPPVMCPHPSFGYRKRHLNLTTLTPWWRLMMVRALIMLTSPSQPCHMHLHMHAPRSTRHGNCMFSHALPTACFSLSILHCTCLALHMSCDQGSHQPPTHSADFKQALGQQSSTGPAPPSKLTTHQTQIVKALIEAHNDDVEVPLKGFCATCNALCVPHTASQCHLPVTEKLLYAMRDNG